MLVKQSTLPDLSKYRGGLHHMSIPQALGVWARFEDAYAGRFSRDVHSFHLYTSELIGHPAESTQRISKERSQQAWEVFIAIATMFNAERACSIFIDGKCVIAILSTKMMYLFEHKVTVTVRPRG